LGAEINKNKFVESGRDILLLGLSSAQNRAGEAMRDLTDQEFHWEPLSPSERLADLAMPPDRKKVWRVFQEGGCWIYDYTPKVVTPPPFTTIAWICNHVAQAGDMYLHCIKTGQPEGVDWRWEDLPVYPEVKTLRDYWLQIFDEARAFLRAIPRDKDIFELNKLTPAPWDEQRPMYRNFWGGIISHSIEHAVQIALLKDQIRFGF
jgi:hypothetical protein